MKFNVKADFRVEFIDLDAVGGLRVLRQRVEGMVDVTDENEAEQVIR